MLLDTYKRKIDYLRISVTDRCNLRCIYCMPEDGIAQKAPWDILNFEEISEVAGLAVSLGVNKIRLTGGEPLVRRGLPHLVELLSSIPGLKDLSLTTNGTLLAQYAKALKEAGLRRLNVSLDTLDSRKFNYITKGGRVEDVLEGIGAVLEEGFLVKVNMVVMKGLNDGEILDFVRFGQEKGVIVRFIELMPMLSSIGSNIVSRSPPQFSCGANNNPRQYDYYVSRQEIKDRLEAIGKLKEIDETIGPGNGPAEYYLIEGLSVAVGFISPISHKFCSLCNRLRLTSDGLLIPCLGNSVCFDLKRALREGKAQEARELIKEAVFSKPREHNFASFSSAPCLMSQVGG